METSSVELDNLLVSILQDCYQYISLKKEFYDIFSDGVFDMSADSILKGTMSFTNVSAIMELKPCFILKENGENCLITTPTPNAIGTGARSDTKTSEDELRQRKSKVQDSEKSGEDWEEPMASDDIQLQKKIEEYKKDPLCLLSAFPTPRQRKAQKTIRKSLAKLAELCTLQRKLESSIAYYESLCHQN